MARRTHNTILRCALPAAIALLLGASLAQAEPVLQLYIEGAQYVSNGGEESWVFQPTDPGPTTFRLWAIGNTDTSRSGYNPIENVRLSVLYDKAYEEAHGPVQIQLTPTMAGGTGSYQGFTDPSTPGNPAFLQTVTDGSKPLLSDGSVLPRHGEYGIGKTWQEFLLGDFNLMDSPLGDFITGFPTTNIHQNGAQINVYEVRVGVENPDAAPPIALHFDLYDSVQAGNKSKSVFAPFSHDAEGGGNPGVIVPEPSTLALSLVGLLAFGGMCRRRRKQTASTGGSPSAA